MYCNLSCIYDISTISQLRDSPIPLLRLLAPTVLPSGLSCAVPPFHALPSSPAWRFKYLHVGGLSPASKKEAAPGGAAEDDRAAATLRRTRSTQLFEMPDKLALELFGGGSMCGPKALGKTKG